jgi:hypothetical protein
MYATVHLQTLCKKRIQYFLQKLLREKSSELEKRERMEEATYGGEEEEE